MTADKKADIMEELKAPVEYISYLKLFRYATKLEVAATIVALVLSIGTALSMVLVMWGYGELNTMFVERTGRWQYPVSPTWLLHGFGGGRQIANQSSDEGARDASRLALLDDVLAYTYAMILQTVLMFVTAVVTVQLLNWAAMRQIARIRVMFLKSVLRQDMAWFDTETTLNFASRMNDDLDKLKEGIAEKVGMFSYLMGTSLLCCLVSFAWGWELTLACLAIVPVSIAVASFISKFQSACAVKEQEACNKAGKVVEEVISAVKTVVAFGGEKREVDRYKKLLEPALEFATRRGIYTGVGMGMSFAIMYAVNFIGFMYGVRLVVNNYGKAPEDRKYYPGMILTIMYNILVAAYNIALAAPHTEAFAAARGAAIATFKILERKSAIDSLSEAGEQPCELKGSVKLDDVHFNYPSRADVRVLRGVTIDIKPGEKVALVGPSGCGKSTVLQLIQRMYQPIVGDVLVDGLDIKKLNVQWLRSRIGVVGQEPVLFSGSVRDNILIGKPGASNEQIMAAAKIANAHDFIKILPNGYDTQIGERGATLSGGQKQRIAIARSIIKEPAILLLDEATSALDPRAEKKVQAALDAASKGRTTIIVSHRLSTILNSDRIICLDGGKVVEEGTHEDLMKYKGFYHDLVTAGNEIQEPEATEDLPETEEIADEIIESTVRRRSFRRSHRPVSFRRGSEWSKRNSMGSMMSLGFHNYVFNDDDDVENDEKAAKEASMSGWKILKLNAPEWPLLVAGSISSLLQGCAFPAFSVLFSLVFGLLALPDPDVIVSKSDLYSSLLLLVAVIAGLTMFVQTSAFTTAGYKLTNRLRVKAFDNYLKQEMAYYDDEENTVGAICARLSSDAAAVQGATGTRLGLIVQGVSTLLLGIVIAMCYSYKMTLVGGVFLPFAVIGVWAEGIVTRYGAEKEKECMENATRIATEAIMNIKTVQSLAMEKQILEKYEKAIEDARVATVAKTKWRGLVYGIGLTMPSLSYNVALIYGGTLIVHEGMSYQTTLLVVESLMHGAFMLGQALVFAPNFTAAKQSAARIMAAIAREPKIVSRPGLKNRKEWKASGQLSMQDIDFYYPTRPNQKVLGDFNLKVEVGKKVALVGHSGSGKSTCVNLLQRFYDPDSGNIELDGKNIQSYLTLASLRKQLGVVQQEPVLFDRSIAENIAYGDNGRKVKMVEIIEAAKQANIHSFIASLPKGYETRLGSGGAQLSGGQKQRVCIARALLRSPRVLLLDEATSALDAHSQKAVSDALQKAGEGRTCIVIAHRLSTVEDADVICVIDKGRIVEQGTHAELLKAGGHYCRLQRMQQTKA